RAFPELLFVETDGDAARTPMTDADPGLRMQLPGEFRPELGGTACPALVGGMPQTLALHPDQTEIAARGAQRDIPLVQDQRTPSFACQTIGDGRADQPAADHDGIVRHAGGSGMVGAARRASASTD